MSIVTRAAANASALQIKAETVDAANTATRVGTLFADLCDSVSFDPPSPFVRVGFTPVTTGTTNSTSITTLATFDSTTLPTNCAGIVKALVEVQNATSALAMQEIQAGFAINGGVLQAGGAGTLLSGSVAQGAASFGYSGNSLLARVTSSDAVTKAYKVYLEVTYAVKT